MRSSALLGLIAWQVMLADCVPMMHQRSDEIPRSLSNIELLIPLVMSDADDASDESDPRAAGERYERAHLDKDMPFSNIPASAFVLDQSHPSSSHKHKRGHKHSRKQDLTSLARSAYLENEESDESEEPDERSELGDPARDLWPLPLPTCPCCAQAAPLWLERAMRVRREFMPMGDNSYWVQNYMKAPRKRPHRPDLGQE